MTHPTYKIAILHTRDPDSSCELRVFIDDIEVPAGQLVIEDIDPGRGYIRSDWDESIAAYDGDDSAFAAAAREALIAAADSKYIGDQDYV